MANIPVEKTSTGTPWWLWLLGLILLALLLWFLIGLFTGDEEVVEDDPVEDVVTEPIADALDLSSVYVTRVVGDNTFFVAPTPGGDDETLVYLEEETDPTNNVEGRYDVTEGQHLSITGSIEPTPGDLSPWGLTDAQAADVGEEYVRATSLEVLDAAADGEITSLDGLGGFSAEYAGRAVRLDGVEVTALAGDSTFYVGSGADRVLVVLENLGESQTGPGTGADGRYNIDVGDMLSINAEVMAFRPGMRGASAMDATEGDGRYVLVVNERGDLTKR